jgi:hypothetical protein
MAILRDLASTHKERLDQTVGITPGQWKRAVGRAQRIEEGELVAGERDWTFLLTIGYPAAGERGVAELARLLTGSEQELPPGPRIWLEGLPVPPRRGEGNTNVDLALGHIAWREGTQGGIRLDGTTPGRWVCFCEMKTEADIQPGVTRDLERNQLARVVENALCFQDGTGGTCCDAANVHVTLVTPRRFGPTARRRTRLYQYKMAEYRQDREALTNDLATCCLPEHYGKGWHYPDRLCERARSFGLHWISWEELFAGMPESPIRPEIRELVRARWKY